MVENDVAPKHHLATAGGDFAMDFLQEVEIDAAFAFRLAEPLALAAAEVPGLIAANVEASAREMGQKLIVQLAQEGQGAGVVRGEGGGIAQKFTARAFVRFVDFGQLFQRRIFKPATQMAEGILVWDEVNAEFAALGVELQNFVAGERTPIAPNGFVVAVGKSVLGVELKFVYFEVGEVARQIEQGLE